MAEQEMKSWWQRSRIRWFAGTVVVLLMIGWIAWWIYFRAYISTNDSRVETNILRVAPVGVGGRIEKVMVEEGDSVKTGQVLVEIDHRVPETQFKKAKARYQLALVELGRAQSLAGKNIAAVKDLDNARANFDMAEADMRLAEINLQNTYLKAPIDGVVIQKPAQPGNVIEPGQAAIVISDVDHAWVEANIEETSIARVRVGQPVSISLDEGGSLTGRVQEITAAAGSTFSLLPAENASGNYTKVVQRIPVKIALDPHPGRVLKSGQSVSVRIRVL